MMKPLLHIFRFLLAHIISAFVAATFAMIFMAFHDSGWRTESVGFLLKLWLVIGMSIAVLVLPFSVIFYAVIEWKQMKMPLWLYSVMGAGFAVQTHARPSPPTYPQS